MKKENGMGMGRVPGNIHDFLEQNTAQVIEWKQNPMTDNKLSRKIRGGVRSRKVSLLIRTSHLKGIYF